MWKASDTEIYETVRRIQANTPLKELNSDQTRFVVEIASIATKSVLELMDRASKGMISVKTQSQFPTVFVEWANQFAIKTHFDRYVAIGLYLRDHEDCVALATTDIGRMYDKSRWKKPANIADIFAKAAERVFFVEADNPSEEGLKLWKLTRTGYDHLMSLKVEV